MKTPTMSLKRISRSFTSFGLRVRLWVAVTPLLLMLAACNGKSSESTAIEETRQVMAAAEMNLETERMRAENALPIAPAQSLPDGYVLDTISLENKDLKHSTLLIFPKAQKSSWEGTQIQEHIDALGKSYVPAPDEVSGGDNSSKFEAWVVGMTRSKHFLSVRYRSKSFYPSHKWLEDDMHSFNLDLDNKTSPQLSDILSIPDEAAADELVTLFNLDNDLVSPILSASEVRKNLQYDIVADTLCLYARGKGTQEKEWGAHKLPLSKVQSFLNPANKKRFDLAR